MFPVLERQLARYEELEKQLQDPDVLSNVSRMLEIQKEIGKLGRIAAAVRKFHRLEGDIDAGILQHGGEIERLGEVVKHPRAAATFVLGVEDGDEPAVRATHSAHRAADPQRRSRNRRLWLKVRSCA